MDISIHQLVDIWVVIAFGYNDNTAIYTHVRGT